MGGISNGDVVKSSRSEIVNALHSRMLQFKDFPSSLEYKKACERLVEKYPVLADKSSSGYELFRQGKLYSVNQISS